MLINLFSIKSNSKLKTLKFSKFSIYEAIKKILINSPILDKEVKNYLSKKINENKILIDLDDEYDEFTIVLLLIFLKYHHFSNPDLFVYYGGESTQKCLQKLSFEDGLFWLYDYLEYEKDALKFLSYFIFLNNDYGTIDDIKQILNFDCFEKGEDLKFYSLELNLKEITIL